MFADHQPTIAAWARRSPDNLARVYRFAAVSARVKFRDMPATLDMASRGEGGVLYGAKGPAWEYAWKHRGEVFAQCEEIATLSRDRRERGTLLMRYLATLPGLGLAKGGFVAQLAYGCAGCLDTVNAARLSLPPQWFNGAHRYRMDRQTTPDKRLRLARWYIATTERLGGPGGLWDDWCAAMAERYPMNFPTADAASAHHLTCLEIA